MADITYTTGRWRTRHNVAILKCIVQIQIKSFKFRFISMPTNIKINLLKSDFQFAHFFSISNIFYILHNNSEVFFFLSIERYLF
jgi:hypothetical protein